MTIENITITTQDDDTDERVLYRKCRAAVDEIGIETLSALDLFSELETKNVDTISDALYAAVAAGVDVAAVEALLT